MSLSPSVAEGFGATFKPKQKYIPDDTPALRSIITIKAKPDQIRIHADEYAPGKIKLSFKDSSDLHYQYLSITDRGFHDFAQKHQNNSELEKVQKHISDQEEIYLRIGLSRSHKAPDGRIGYWLQVNGLYSFPDYPKEIRQYL